jgi:hypothetical protein
MAESTLADRIKKGRQYLPMPTLQNVKRVMRSGAIAPPLIAGAVAIKMGDAFQPVAFEKGGSNSE